MSLLKGVYTATKKNGTIYYRSSITHQNKHISLGSFPTELSAHKAYLEAWNLINGKMDIYDYTDSNLLTYHKFIVLINFRDNKYYVKNPIYLHKYYFSYFLDQSTELIFDVDDLFYYSNHKIFKKNGYLFVNDYGMQINILSRYGIKNFAVNQKDYYFKDSDSNNLRYHNIIVINKYYGVEKIIKNDKVTYLSKIHINGYTKIGTFKTDIEAAIAYNKAVDFIIANNISSKNYSKNYISEINSKEDYLELYDSIRLPKNIVSLRK
ncbi:hypothetical protein AN1V17_07450 [Vallitalea sediminicola]